MERLRWLCSLQGRVGRRPFLVWGAALMASKVALDGALCTWVFGLQWSPLLYWLAMPVVPRSVGTAPQLWLALSSLPFAWLGLTLSVRRLRDAGSSPWYVALFVLPILNLVLFALLAVIPTASAPRSRRKENLAPAQVRLFEYGIVPAIVAALVTLGLGYAGLRVLGSYAYATFLGLPFAQGMAVGLLTCRRPFGVAMLQLFLSFAIDGVGLLVFGWEGLMCIVMTVPVLVPMGLFGLGIARSIVSLRWQHVVPVVVLIPMLQVVEPHVLPRPATHEARTEVVVSADRATVWKHLVAFSQLPPPTELPFRVGIAYPTHGTIEGHGPGAVRRCTFSTGDFVEPIEVWDEPRLLRFSVDECPQPMVEWNPFHDHVDAAHLHGTFLAHRGQFELVDRGDGTTLLAGTTWYSHGLWPESYWSLWSDWLIHTIHRRVLAHIGSCAEADRPR